MSTEPAVKEVFRPITNDRSEHFEKRYDLRAMYRVYGAELVRVVEFEGWISSKLTAEQHAQHSANDDAARDEAHTTGHLLYYHSDEPVVEYDQEGTLKSSLHAKSSCGWNNAQASVDALHGPNHIQSKEYALNNDVYDDILVSVHDIATDHQNQTYTITETRFMTKAMLEAHRQGAA